MIETFNPKWLRRASKRIEGFNDSLVLAKRISLHGKATFALGYDYGGRQFPEWVWTDLPLYRVKELVNDAIRGARVIKSYDTINNLVKIGEKRSTNKRAIKAFFDALDDLLKESSTNWCGQCHTEAMCLTE